MFCRRCSRLFSATTSQSAEHRRCSATWPAPPPAPPPPPPSLTLLPRRRRFPDDAGAETLGGLGVRVPIALSPLGDPDADADADADAGGDGEGDGDATEPRRLRCACLLSSLPSSLPVAFCLSPLAPTIPAPPRRRRFARRLPTPLPRGCPRQTGHCQNDGTCCSGGEMQDMWYTSVHVSQHSSSPGSSHTSHTSPCSSSDAYAEVPRLFFC